MVGLGLVAGGVLSCWALMAEASERHDVLVLRRSVPAGEVIAAEDVGVVAIGTGDDIPTIPAGRYDEVVGQYTRYRLAAGALLVDDNLQPGPLVTPGRALVSVVVGGGDIPAQITVGDEVVLIAVGDPACGVSSAVSIVGATVTSAPHRAPGSSAAGLADVVVSVEVDDDAVAVVALAGRVVIARPNSPAADAALDGATSGDVIGCAVDGTTGGSATAGAGEAVGEDPAAGAPVPTGVTPIDPAEVLVDADG